MPHASVSTCMIAYGDHTTDTTGLNESLLVTYPCEECFTASRQQLDDRSGENRHKRSNDLSQVKNIKKNIKKYIKNVLSKWMVAKAHSKFAASLHKSSAPTDSYENGSSIQQSSAATRVSAGSPFAPFHCMIGYPIEI